MDYANEHTDALIKEYRGQAKVAAKMRPGTATLYFILKDMTQINEELRNRPNAVRVYTNRQRPARTNEKKS